jgi:cathepsin H
MRIAVAILAFVGFASVSASRLFLQESDEALDTFFNLYLARQGKSYSTKEEYLRRREIFVASVQLVQEHNARNDAAYSLGLNKFSDLTQEEFEAMLLGDNGAPEPEQITTESSTRLGQIQVSPIDWRDKGVVGPVKDQGKCGSCWSFSTAGPIEEHYAIKYGQQIVLAEQQLVDCSWPFGNQGCNGGLYANGYAYVKQFGLMLNSSYPYIHNDTECQYDAT